MGAVRLWKCLHSSAPALAAKVPGEHARQLPAPELPAPDKADPGWHVRAGSDGKRLLSARIPDLRQLSS